MLADDVRNINGHGWDTFQFHGRSVYMLRSEVAQHVGQPDITVCARAGRYGRLTPLTIDLPMSFETMDIIVLVSGTPRENLIFCS